MSKNSFILICSVVIVICSYESANAFTWPIDFGQSSAPLTSPFGPRLLNSKYDFHSGVDIRTQNSTTVVASHDGYADWVGSVSGYGLMIFLGETYYAYATGYAHLADTVNLNYPSEEPILEGWQIAVSGGGDKPHLHFNYYTRNVDELYYGDHPDDPDAENPMNILPYSDDGWGPDSPFESRGITGSNENVTTVFFNIETKANELDLNVINLFLWGQGVEVNQNFDTRENINTSDGSDNTQSKNISTADGTIKITFTVYNFDVDTDEVQTLGVEYDFSSYSAQIYAQDIQIDIYDLQENWLNLDGFSASYASQTDNIKNIFLLNRSTQK